MDKLTEQEYARKPDGGLAEQIEVLEAFAEGDAYNTELLMLLIELRSIRSELAAIKALPVVAWRWRFFGQDVVTLDKNRADKSNEMGVDDFTELFTHPAPAVASRFKLIPQNPSLAMLTVLGLTGSFESMTEKYHKMLALAQATSGDTD
ncbi:hypothetical protein ACMVR0_001276 [Yersinia enterocolitica]